MRIISIIFFLLLQEALLFAQSVKEIESYKLNMDYAESLSKKADFYFSIQNYEKAVLIIQEKADIVERLSGKDNIEYAICLIELAQYVANTGDYNKSIKLSVDALTTIEKTEGGKSPYYALASDKLSNYYYLSEDYESSLVYGQKAFTLYTELYGTESEWYISSKTSLGNIYSKLSKNNEALAIQKEIIDYWKNKGDTYRYAVSLHDSSFTFANLGNYEKAIEQVEEAIAIFEKVLGESDWHYIGSLKTLADYYIEMGNFEKAYENSEKQLELYRKYCGENSVEYIRGLSNQAYYYGKGGNYQKAIDIENKAITLQQELTPFDSLDYAKALCNLANFNKELGFLDKSISFITQSLHILSDYKNTIAYRTTLSILAACYLQLGDFDKAIEINRYILAIFGDRGSSEYFGYLSNLANCYYMENDYDSAIEIYEMVLDNQKRLLGENNVDYANSLENLASCYAETGRLQDALKLQEKCVSILNDIFGNDNAEYAFSSIKLGYIYRCVGDDVKSKELQEKALETLKNDKNVGLRYVDALEQMFWNYIFKDPESALNIAKETKAILDKHDQQTTMQHVSCLENLVYAYMYLGNYKEALDVFEKDFETPEIKNYLLKNKDRYVTYLNKKSELFTKLKRYKESIEIEKNALEICKGMNDAYLSRCGIYINLCLNYVLQNDMQGAANLMKESDFIMDLRDKVYYNVNSLTSKNRASFWNKVSGVFTQTLPVIAVASKDSTLFPMVYDLSALFAKSILLREDLKLSNAIMKCADPKLQDSFKKYQENLADLNKGGLDFVGSDSLYRATADQEDKLKQIIAKHKLDSIAFVSWKDIQNCLKNGDVAIEFLSIILDDGQKGHAALVLKKDYDSPHMFPLCFKAELDSVLSQSKKSEGLYKLIWEPIERELENANNIFFSPAGEFYNIGIEYLSDCEGKCISDKHDVYRLSSTQELLNSDYIQGKTYNKAVLYGGLVYDIIPSNIPVESENEYLISPKENGSNIRAGLRDSINNRGSFEPLYGTANEVKEIERVMKDKNIDCKVYEGIYGTEETFKRMSNVTDILHIATHGMYIGDEQRDFALEKNFNFILSEQSNNVLSEDVALTRSFLVMSGGDMLPRRYNIKRDMEDGILTAEEISRLDLHGLDLVVLSACQSGLGDISHEGVLGLQRGFKKAGANTLLMSLDKVDDEATKILMVEFYKNLMAGKSKHQSLKDAQKYLREIDNGKYDKPEYWASFIMLDGIN